VSSVSGKKGETTMRVLLLAIVMALSIALLATPAFAANPHQGGSTGQPDKECGDDGPLTPGFSTGGFENAESHYAGSPNTPSANHANSDKAVSQYDVACFQQA
jgi:hypothetical protein